MDAEIKRTLDALNGAFEAFKSSNDQRLAEIQAKGSASADLIAKVEKSNADITAIIAKHDELRKQIRDVETVQARVHEDPRDPKVLAKERTNVAAFFASVRNQPIAEQVSDTDVEAYRNYRKAFALAMRRGDKNIAPEFQAALTVGTDTQGGLWAPIDLSGRVVELLYETSPVRQIADVTTTAAPDLEGYNDLNEAGSGWVGEQSARPETGTPDIGAWKIPLMEQYAAPRATQRTIDFSIRNIEEWLARKVSDKVSRVENNGFVAGNGVAKPRGFTTYPAGTPTAALWNVIQQIATGVSGAYPATNPGDTLIDVIFSVKAPYRQNARWLMGRLTLAATRKLKDGQGNYLWEKDFQKSVAGTLCGYPITEAEDMPALGANSLSVAFGDFKQGYQVVDHTTGIRVLRDPFTAKPYIVFYTTRYVGGDVVNFEALKLIKFG
jgi:HK97 family phage major capsid protein